MLNYVIDRSKEGKAEGWIPNCCRRLLCADDQWREVSDSPPICSGGKEGGCDDPPTAASEADCLLYYFHYYFGGAETSCDTAREGVRWLPAGHVPLSAVGAALDLQPPTPSFHTHYHHV